MPHPAINHAARKALTIHARMAQHTELDLDDFAVFAADVYRHGYRLNLGAYTHVIGRRWQELFACFDRGYGVLCATPERSALDFDFAVASGALAEDGAWVEEIDAPKERYAAFPPVAEALASVDL